MPWPLVTLRQRRIEVRDKIAAELDGADASVPNTELRAIAEAQAAFTHDNDLHLDYLAKMAMPDTAAGEWADRWANIWLPEGRKAASLASGTIVVTGAVGAIVPTGAVLTADVVGPSGNLVRFSYSVITGVTLTATSATVGVVADLPGADGNRDAGASLLFSVVPAGISGAAVVTAAGLAGGAEAESDADLIARYIDAIQNPPHGGNANDWKQWALAIPGVTRAFPSPQEMGVGTMTVRVMLDVVRAGDGGFPTSGDLAMVKAALDLVRPVTVADLFVVAPIAQPVNLTITDLIGDTPETRAAIRTELAGMFLARAQPGGIVYASWIGEAISNATGEDHHTTSQTNVIPTSAGHLITLGTITYA